MQAASPSVMQWSESLVLNHAHMDATHQEFVALLSDLEQAEEVQLLAMWDTLVAHTEAHFAQEDRWMVATGFAPDNCHSSQHAVVLEILKEGAQKARAGDVALLRAMAAELGAWFVHHAQTMDAALAQHLQAVDFDVYSGCARQTHALPAAAIHGCGGACSTPV